VCIFLNLNGKEKNVSHHHRSKLRGAIIALIGGSVLAAIAGQSIVPVIGMLLGIATALVIIRIWPD